jgi:hypothetical protein
MKTRLIGFMTATFLTAILFTGNVYAHETKVNVVSGLENVMETKLELENWMLDKAYWNANQVKLEESLVIEDWMIDENHWTVPVYEYQVAEKDSQLVIETWMINEQYWN